MSELNTAQKKLLSDLIAVLNHVAGDTGTDEAPAKATATRSKKVSAPATADPVEDDADEAVAERTAELNAMTLAKLRKEAAKYFEAEELDGVGKKDLVENIIAAESDVDAEPADDDADEDDDDDEEAAADEDEDEDADDDESDELDRDTLEEMSLPALRKLAKGYDLGDFNPAKADKDTIIAALLGEDDEEAENEEDEEEGLTDEDLAAMSIAELKKTAKEYGYDGKFPLGIKADKLIGIIQDLAEAQIA